jgi:hypothetical protein
MSQGRIKLLIAGIVSLLLLSSFSCWRIFRDGWRITKKTETYLHYNDSKENIQELNLFVTETNYLTSSWVFLPEDLQGKNRLLSLHSTDYPALKKSIESSIEFWDDLQKRKLQGILTDMDTLVSIQKKTTDLLRSIEDYEEPAKVEAAKKILLDHLVRRGKAILNDLKIIQKDLDRSAKGAWDESIEEIESADEVSLLLSILMFISGILGLTIIISGIRFPGKSVI